MERDDGCARSAVRGSRCADRAGGLRDRTNQSADCTRGSRGRVPNSNRPSFARHKEDIVVLAFSGGGTRAAAFSYGVLEVLRDTEVIGPKGERQRLLDLVDVITGVSGGSFTALAYGLYGDRLFGEYEQRFLKRNVEGELIGRVLSPVNWGSLASPDWGRSELAADLYDEILFDGATFADLQRKPGPMIVAAATDLTSGGRSTTRRRCSTFFALT